MPLVGADRALQDLGCHAPFHVVSGYRWHFRRLQCFENSGCFAIVTDQFIEGLHGELCSTFATPLRAPTVENGYCPCGAVRAFFYEVYPTS